MNFNVVLHQEALSQPVSVSCFVRYFYQLEDDRGEKVSFRDFLSN